WQLRIQQYLQHEHYAQWEVIEFGDSYEVPANTTDTTDTTTTTTTSGETGTKSGRTVTLTAEDMQKKKNDVKVRTTLLLSLPDMHRLRFSKYKTVRELWAAILKTFGGNEATKKTKKNLLKQQYRNFRAEGSKTLEQTFRRLNSAGLFRGPKEDEIEASVNPASSETSFAGGGVEQFIVAPSVPYVGDAGTAIEESVAAEEVTTAESDIYAMTGTVPDPGALASTISASSALASVASVPPIVQDQMPFQ
nr:hypothetical protein [Tanacetum cinerariifolium]